MALNQGIIATLKRPNIIIANSVPLTTTQSNPAIELKNNGSALNQEYVRSLLDVVEDHPQDGYTLVYNSSIHKYEVKAINQVINLDGGTF